MRRTQIVIACAGLLAVTGCARVSATQVGQTAGSVLGALLAPGIGMPFGALMGTLAGVLLDRQAHKVQAKKEHAELSAQLETEPPVSADLVLLHGEPTRVWVDERIEQGQIIAGHFEQRRIH